MVHESERSEVDPSISAKGFTASVTWYRAAARRPSSFPIRASPRSRGGRKRKKAFPRRDRRSIRREAAPRSSTPTRPSPVSDCCWEVAREMARWPPKSKSDARPKAVRSPTRTSEAPALAEVGPPRRERSSPSSRVTGTCAKMEMLWSSLPWKDAQAPIRRVTRAAERRTGSCAASSRMRNSMGGTSSASGEVPSTPAVPSPPATGRNSDAFTSGACAAAGRASIAAAREAQPLSRRSGLRP